MKNQYNHTMDKYFINVIILKLVRLRHRCISNTINSIRIYTYIILTHHRQWRSELTFWAVAILRIAVFFIHVSLVCIVIRTFPLQEKNFKMSFTVIPHCKYYIYRNGNFNSYQSALNITLDYQYICCVVESSKKHFLKKTNGQ